MMAGLEREPWTATSSCPRSVWTRSSGTGDPPPPKQRAVGKWSWMFFSSMSSMLSDGIVLKFERKSRVNWAKWKYYRPSSSFVQLIIGINGKMFFLLLHKIFVIWLIDKIIEDRSWGIFSISYFIIFFLSFQILWLLNYSNLCSIR